MDIESLRREYEGRKAKYDRLKEEIIFILEQEFQVQQIPIHQIVGRIRPFESLIDKARRQESEEPFKTVSDVCGVRVICLFISDLLKIGQIVEDKFTIHEKDDKIFSKAEEAFGYLSVHYIASLPASCSGPRYDDLKELKFEIQLRTIAMHAWATISHYLDYKSPFAIPSALRKDFNALSALFYLADSHFELFFRSSKEAKEIAEQKKLPEIAKEEINLDTLVAYLRMKYPDRRAADSKVISSLVEELQAAGYTRIRGLDTALRRSATAFEAYEKDNPPKPGPTYADIGAVRISLSILDESYLKGSRPPVPQPYEERYRKYRHLLS